MITTCTDCHALYDAGSEEQAYEPERWCPGCRRRRNIPCPPDLYPSNDATADSDHALACDRLVGDSGPDRVSS